MRVQEMWLCLVMQKSVSSPLNLNYITMFHQRYVMVASMTFYPPDIRYPDL